MRSIWKNLHLTEFFTRAAPVVPVTNMRYEQWSVFKNISWREHQLFVQENKNVRKVKAASSMWIQKTCNFQNKLDILEIFLKSENGSLACLPVYSTCQGPAVVELSPGEAFKIKIQRSKMPQRYRYISHSHVSDTDIKIYKRNHHSHTNICHQNKNTDLF